MKKITKFFFLLATFPFLFGGCLGEKEENIDNTGNNYAVISIKDYGTITIQLYPDYAPVAVYNFCKKARDGLYDGKNFHRVVADFMIQGGSYDGTGASDPNAETFKAEVNPNMRHYYGALCMAATSAGDISDSFYIVNGKDTSAFEQIIADIDSYSDTAQQYKDALSQLEEEIKSMGGESALTADQLAYAEYMRATYQNSYKHFTNLVKYAKEASDEVKAKYAEVGGSPFLDGGYTVFGYTVEGFDVIDKISEVEVTVQSEDPESEVSKPVSQIIIEKIEIKSEL